MGGGLVEKTSGIETSLAGRALRGQSLREKADEAVGTEEGVKVGQDSPLSFEKYATSSIF